MHDERGGQSASPKNADRVVRHLVDKLERNRADIVRVRGYGLEDADAVVISFGCTARSALAAVRQARGLRDGLRAGMLELTTLWPFPDDEVREVLSRAKLVVVAELNLGQAEREVRRLNEFGACVLGVNRVDGDLITPDEILAPIAEALS
jgi:2-oxoglutarate ferredoxin oxidoreductase subunit alpha